MKVLKLIKSFDNEMTKFVRISQRWRCGSFLKLNVWVNVILGQKYFPPTGCSAHLKSTQGYFSARSRLNEGVRSATAIMMWLCGWNGQKKATNFGQTSGQLQTRHTQTKTMLNMKYASLIFIQLYLHWSIHAAKG